MMFQFHLPDIGEGVIEGEVVSWKVKEGDIVTLDQPMVEIMTDKATVEIPSPRAGTIAKINFSEGEICPVGDVLVEIAEQGKDGNKAASIESAIGSGVATITAPNATACDPSRTATMTAAVVPAVGTIAGANALVGAEGQGARVLATPSVRRLARNSGVELASIPGTGRNGRVTKEDLQQYISNQHSTENTLSTQLAVTTASSLPVRSFGEGLEERVPFRGVRKAISDAMARSTSTAAHFTYVEEVDMTELVIVRNRAKQKALDRGVKLTYLPFLVKAIVSGLQRWPQLNASLDEANQEIVQKKYYHIGIAAQGPQGLVVTVIRDADKRSIFGLSREIQRLATAVQDGSIKREELTGSTFTISSLGKLGGVMATPIINFPEVGIVGVHKMEQKPAVRDGEIVARWLMNLSISLDHRVVDGWDGAMFLQDVKTLLEDPTSMFMDMI